MRKFVKRLGFVLLIIVIILAILYFYSMSIQEKEIKNGNSENSIMFDVSNIPNGLTITFVGDSITQGCMVINKDTDCDYFADNEGYRDNITLNLNTEESYNFAVGGYTTNDLLNQMNTNVTLGEVNNEIIAETPKLASSISRVNDDLTIENAIKESDIVISTIGANDILDAIVQNDDGSIGIDYGILKSAVGKANKNKTDIYDQMRKINPDIQIYDVGMYMAYPHIGDDFVNKLYPVLVFAEHSLFIDKPSDNIFFVKIRDNMQTNIKEFVPNPTNVHPTNEGYNIIANEVLKVISSTYK